MAHASASGPDFSLGVDLEAVPDGGTLAGRVGTEPALLSHLDGRFFAVSGACTHYHAALADGLIDRARVVCPLHHACFDLRTGEALHAPALDALDRWRVDVDGGKLFVREKIGPATGRPTVNSPGKVVIVGGGAAALACANELRRLGHDGAILMLSADRDPPYDRPNLSKDYLAGNAPDEWMPLRSAAWFRERAIDLRLETRIGRIDPDRRVVHSCAGEDFSYDRLLLATGSEPHRLQVPGFDRDNVFTLRSFGDARSIGEHARPGARAVVVGSSFIGLEAAAALRQRGVEVEIVSAEKVPFNRILGPDVGLFFRRLHEQHGVVFHLGQVPSSFDGRAVHLPDGTSLAVDFVLVGIGVRPRLELAQAAGLAIDNGLCVDAYLETERPGIYAAGDIAAYPDALSQTRLRIEHWVTAQRQGQIVAANMLGLNRPFDAVPFFWTEQYGLALRYAGHSAKWDEVRIDGSIDDGDFTARYYEGGAMLASASAGRDKENLADERRLEQMLCRSRAEASGTRAPRPHQMAGI